jgi:hypothetical protein
MQVEIVQANEIYLSRNTIEALYTVPGENISDLLVFKTILPSNSYHSLSMNRTRKTSPIQFASCRWVDTHEGENVKLKHTFRRAYSAQ